MFRMRLLLPLLLLAACGPSREVHEDRPESHLFAFDNNKTGDPWGWKIDATNQVGPLAIWKVVEEDGGKVLAITDVQRGAKPTFNLCWTPAISMRDCTVSVRVRAGKSGRFDRGGGPMWRVQDKNNYYVARWNPLEDNFRIYYVKDGKRVQLDSADVKLDPAAWHTIRIHHKGARSEGFLDDEKLLDVEDTTLPDAGGIGVWAKADALTTFDDLSVAPR
jgi:hypothetical protein